MREFVSDLSQTVVMYVGHMDSTGWTYVFAAVVLFGCFCLKGASARTSI